VGAAGTFMTCANVGSAWGTGKRLQHVEGGACGTGIERASLTVCEWAALTVDHHIVRVTTYEP
jgi:hypothetical protein